LRIGSRRLQPAQCLTILFLLLTLSGCTTLKLATTHFEKPTFTYVKSELVETTRSQAIVNFIFIAHNPNEAGLKNVSVSYELYVEERKLMNGTDLQIDLNPHGDTEVKVPATLLYSDLTPVLGSIVERILLGKKTIPITINAVFSGKPAIYTVNSKDEPITFELRMTKKAEVPLMRER
jgi:LEA14-like dessication related protein